MEGHNGSFQSTQDEPVIGTKMNRDVGASSFRKQHHAGATDSPPPSIPPRWGSGRRGNECVGARELWTPWTRGLCFLGSQIVSGANCHWELHSGLTNRTAFRFVELLPSPCWPYYLHLSSIFRREIGRIPSLRGSHEYFSPLHACPVLSWWRGERRKPKPWKFRKLWVEESEVNVALTFKIKIVHKVVTQLY